MDENLISHEVKCKINQELKNYETKIEINTENKENLNTETTSLKIEEQQNQENYFNEIIETNLKESLQTKTISHEKLSDKILRKLEFHSDDKVEHSLDGESDDYGKNQKKHSNNSSSFDSDDCVENQEIVEKNLKNLDKINDNKKSIDGAKFYEKKLKEKKETTKKLEILRKKAEIEAIARAKPLIDSGSKKIMEKHGFIKPIYERAKEIEVSKKNKIENIKKTTDEKIAKIEEENLKSRTINSNKQFDEKEFEKWRANKLEWENNKKLKIESKKEIIIKQKNDERSTFYHPNINKKKDMIINKKINSGVHNKLYSMRNVKDEKLMQKIIESIPEFKPIINKKLPFYLKKSLQNENIKEVYKTQTHRNNTRNNQYNFNEVYASCNPICLSERKENNGLNFINLQKCENISEDEFFKDDDPIQIENDIINQYKTALEMSSKIHLNAKHNKSLSNGN